MRVIFISLITSLLIAFAFSQSVLQKEKKYLQEYALADKLFHKAEKLSTKKEYDEALEEKLNGQSLAAFQSILPIVKKVADDSLAFFCHLKIGILQHYFDSIQLAKNNYLNAIALKQKLPQIKDSFLFQPLLFTARIYYSLNKFDSAYIYYKKAEKITELYHVSLNEEQRLYNGLGAIYFETGNFKQAKNYFEKAALLLSKSDPSYKDFIIAYKINIGSCLVRLEKFKEADEVYSSLLQYKITTNEILQNVGFVNLSIGNSLKAIDFFKKIKYNNSTNIILYNQLGKAYLNLAKKDSAEKYYMLALEENKKWNDTRKNNAHGTTYQYVADKFVAEKNYVNGIDNYQKAVLQFYPDYNETDVYKNPTIFSGVFSYINLFNTLAAKADAFEKLYEQDKKQASLDAALNAYRSAFFLADYVEKTYDSDEARLFLNKIKYRVHDRPIHISLQLYEITKNNHYLEEAYNFDQQNKASVLSLNVQESSIKSQTVTDAGLFEKETSIKSNITRLSLKARQINDSNQLEKIKAETRDNEIELGKLQDKINELPGYKVKKYANGIPTIAALQKILNKKTAILSYHLSGNELVILCISSNDISYTKQAIDSTFFSTVKSFKASLNFTKSGQKYDGDAVSLQLYNVTIKPIFNKLEHIDNLLIIPDDELNSLPFEALNDENGNYLFEKFSVQYQYSTALLRNNINDKTFKTVLAMAPFASRGNEEFTQLIFTKKEIENLKGDILLDSAATKNNFIAKATKSGIIHLATHTIVNDTLPEKSLIAFYPFTNLATNENNLYAQEIYNLKLTGTKLVVLSACETGNGQLSKGEGLMSLARAFTYAGCPNIIASLWKADDKSTAWIMQRYYHYYYNNTSAATSLQKAKLDYINSPDIEKKYKSPNYWAHLVLTGIPEKEVSSYAWLWAICISSFLILLFYLFVKRKKRTYDNNIML